MRLLIPRSLRLTLLLFASGLLMTTACLVLARRDPSQQHELLVLTRAKLDQHQVSRLNPANGVLTPLSPALDFAFMLDIDACNMLVSRRGAEELTMFRFNYCTGETKPLLSHIAAQSIRVIPDAQPYALLYDSTEFYVVTDLLGQEPVTSSPTRQLPNDAFLNTTTPYMLSPDRAWITFQGTVAGHDYDVLVAKLDGSELRNLTEFWDDDIQVLDWTPADGGWLILNTRQQFFKIRPDGSDFSLIYEDTYSPIVYYSAFHTNQTEWADWVILSGYNRQAHTRSLMGIDLSGAQPTWSIPAVITSQTWEVSPDGRWLYFIMANALYRIHPDGTAHERIASLPPGNNSLMPWLSNRQQLAFDHWSQPNGPAEFYLINRDNGEMTQLARLTLVWRETFYAPDKQWLYYTVDRGRGSGTDLYRVRLQNGHAEQVSDSARIIDFFNWGRVIDRAWSPLILVGLAGLLVGSALGLALPEFS